ncbi:hypothetical protein KIH39_07110 [Telmatocola sphagniphila]|jgi:hypothetical protein|uniref:Uncharacterized protein n=1 Tax=Telmatocola sphagniphila TaxID=1123043 RepID=A0A8E6EW67_9BACT|nr:hypothetical protein [Telmatocola sphagniphila]QVL33670.1 hypothetical protein KIH39_07110 [Telmatocola sphagniphila]
MARKTNKTQIVAFKVEEDLADFLNKLPNKSDFIRKAIVAQFGMECPLCSGTGVVPCGIHNHYKQVITDNNTHPCEKCGGDEPFPMKSEGIAKTDRKRLEQFLHGGPLYCKNCYEKLPACDDCGWHLPVELAADHVRKAHTQN